MRNRRPIDVLLPLVVFIALESAAIAMVTGSGIVQRYKILNFSRNLAMGLWEISGSVHNFINYGEENRRLAQENVRLRQQIDDMSARLVGHTSDTVSNFRYISAKVVRNSTNLQSNYILLDAGSDLGVAPGMGVVTDCGAIGIVEAVDRHYCRVVSFLNASQTISAKINGCGSFGLLSWSGTSIDKAFLREVPTHATVSVGDTVSTSGYSSIFPPDIPVGIVRQFKSDGIYITLETQLLQDFNSLQYVNIVSNSDIHELKGLKNGN